MPLLLPDALGIAVALDDRQDGRARYVRLSDRRSGQSRAAILLRPEPRFERQQWAVAHEIGEHVAYRVFPQWGVDPREAAAERPRSRWPTTWPAGCCCRRPGLRPTARPAIGTCSALKARYPTASHELIARRMLECRPPVIISIFDHRRTFVSPQQPAGPGAAALAGRNRLLARRPRSNRPLRTSDGAGVRPRLADPRGGVEAGDSADGNRRVRDRMLRVEVDWRPASFFRGFCNSRDIDTRDPRTALVVAGRVVAY